MALRIYDDVLDLVRQTKPILDRVGRHDADLARQGRRAMTSTPLNIAEGARQRGGLGRARFENAMGSADETRAVLQTAAAAATSRTRSSWSRRGGGSPSSSRC